MLKLKNITFEYIKNQKILNNLNAEYQNGLNIVFANRGEGKTTLLDLILFPKPKYGSFVLFETAVSEGFGRLEISAIQSDWFLKDKKTAKENFDASKRRNLLPDSFFKAVEFEKIACEKVGSLLVADKFKTAVVRALKKAPSLLVLDSPFHVHKDDAISLLTVLEGVLSAYAKTVKKPLCTLLLSRPFEVANREVSLLQGGSIIEKAVWEKIQNQPRTTEIAVNFAKYPNNVFCKEDKNYYVNGDNVKIGSEYRGILTGESDDFFTVEFESESLDIFKIEGCKTGDEVAVDIPKAAITKLD